MLRMIRYELKKIFDRSIVIGALAVLLLIGFVLLQACCFNNSSTSLFLPDGTKLSGQAAIQHNQAVARRYEGNYTDQTVAQMVSDFAREYPEDYRTLSDTGEINLSVPSPYLYLTMFIPPANYDEIAKDAIQQGSSIPPLTEYGLISLHDYHAAYIEKPLQYGYSDSWAFFFTGFCGPTLAMAIPALLVIIIAVSTVFSGEYNMRTDSLILTSKYGKSRQIIAKLLASLIFTILVIGTVFLVFCIAFGVQYGIAGWNADMQTNLGLSLIAVEIPFNNLQLILFGLLIVWIAGIFTAAATAMLSSLTKTPFSSLIVALAVFVAPGIIRQVLSQGKLRDALIVFPINAVNVQEVLRLPVNITSAFCGLPYSPAVCVAAVSVIVFFIAGTIAYYAFKHHQTI